MQWYIRCLTEKEAVAAVGYAHRPYAIAAWRFLTKTGYINFGVAPGMAAKQSGNRDEPPKGTVIVVGAGMAGKLRCAQKSRQLQHAYYVHYVDPALLHACVQHGSDFKCTAPCILHELQHARQHACRTACSYQPLAALQGNKDCLCWSDAQMTCRLGSSSSAGCFWV